ncbi:hypothetical protein RQM65_18535 [Pricia sp. S334]|uniref:Uncharacterized protein n=1 Tax=Pricia mediterranea TaxID=3076079 RepID=A0ABU3LAR9_9FLAO|nr:hypothetical protein [Pricia sp. S334]MDT7830673.1 hypothetical protein [Pricia sp. S334]
MALYYDSFENNPPEGFNKDLKIEGLKTFTNHLERHFFSNVSVRNYADMSESVKLAIELDCNLSLVEMLFHFTKGTWGDFAQGNNSFIALIDGLIKKNDVQIDAEEVTFLFKDTTIVITKIYHNSIGEQLEQIFTQLGKHYVHFSNGLTETPYEIYIPVFEEGSLVKDVSSPSIKTRNPSRKDYFRYWGLYCESEEDAVIYNLKKSSIERGDLIMLNQ